MLYATRLLKLSCQKQNFSTSTNIQQLTAQLFLPFELCKRSACMELDKKASLRSPNEYFMLWYGNNIITSTNFFYLSSY